MHTPIHAKDHKTSDFATFEDCVEFFLSGTECRRVVALRPHVCSTGLRLCPQTQPAISYSPPFVSSFVAGAPGQPSPHSPSPGPWSTSNAR